ncbi:Fic family protein [Corynebacterium sp.]|uniref:Fic family protein n=1 Tax=Corynebacterium sp. TaxID=1720 RepID=UPI0028A75B27|nr:Fic family protein [Corynebacterium sp.]
MNSSKYRQLKIVLHQASSLAAAALVDKEYDSRFNSNSALHWNYRVKKNLVFVNVVDELAVLLEQVWRSELAIQKLWRVLPRAAQEQYLISLLVSEIQATNEIEGIHSTRKEIRLAIKAAEKSSKGKASSRRFQEMAQTYLLLFGGLESGTAQFPKDLADTRELYDKLLAQEIDNEDRLDGEFFRTGSVFVSDGQSDIHRGVEGEELINTGVQTLLEAQQDDEHVLGNAFVAHFILEHIHPFYDGNGRFGRFLLGLRLSEILSAPTAISLSSEVLQQKRAYYKSFMVAEDELNRGELTFFVIDMAKILVNAMEGLLESLREKSNHLDSLNGRLQELNRKQAAEDDALEDKHLSLLFIMGQVYLFGPRSGVTLKELCEVTGLSQPTVREMTKSLRERGLIEETSQRPLVFALTQKALELLGLPD